MIRWLLASLPLIALLVTMLWMKWNARKAGLLGYILALVVAGAAFGAYPYVLGIASAKGVSLTLFVVLIIWTSSFMFQVVNETGTIPVISKWMATITSDRLMLGLLISWGLSGVIQAVAGYGVPVAVCAPLMIAAGFEPVVAAAATLVGHAWSITFGSMGASYYTLNLSTKLPGDLLGHWVGLTFVVPTIVTGLAVAHITDGWAGVKRSFPKVVPIGLAMSLTQWVVARAGSAQVAALLGSIVGMATIALMAPRSKDTLEQEPPARKGSVHVALVPYYALLVLTMISQIGPVKAFFKPYKFGIDYPSVVTAQGHVVAAEKAYAAIGIFSHPAPIIALAVLIGVMVYMAKGMIGTENIKKAWKATVKQAYPTTVGVLFMVMMAVVMMDSGMTREMALGVSRVTGRLFPLVSPFVGVLGCFMTGSNTNGNVLFGAFQIETAKALGISQTLLAGSQTCGASLGSAIAPAKVLLGSSTTGLVGQESLLLKKALPYCMLVVGILGIQTLIATSVLNVVP